MESIEDDLNLPIPEEPPSPIYKPKLKRLKKSSSSPIAEAARVSDDSMDQIQDPSSLAESEKEKDFEDDLDPLFSLPSRDPIAARSGKGDDFEEDFDPLFSGPAIDEEFETLDLERGIEEKIEKGKTVRKRLNLDEGSEDISKKRRKKKSDENPKETVREKRKTEKERRAQLEQIHADSQRLLRETRDASFKPVPVVQKPISSVLEKIRLRKLEVLRQTSILCQSDSASLSDCSMDDIIQKNTVTIKTQKDARDNLGAEVAVGIPRSPEDHPGEIPCNNEATKTVVKSNRVFDDLGDSADRQLPASNLSPVPDDLSSEEEEEDDKENIDPCPSSAVNMDSSPEHGLAKAFLDDEAEEEDDSDNDLMRFQDNEEDDESDADEVLNDLIATGYKEAPTDHDKRNQLHQKWLEQQDAAGTDDILQRLKYGKKQSAPTCLHDEDVEEDEDDIDEESADEKSYDPPVIDDARQNSKKAKQMIAQMFTDADDVYVHSDDEEAEQTLIRQRILKQTDESSFVSPVEDEHSREVFGLIKKLNIVPVTKKKGKTVTSSFDSLMIGGNSNSSSKSSFLNRTAGTSLPSSHKQASATVRAYIFGRDDSNSRSGISTSESISDMDPEENHISKSAASKVKSSSQFRSTAKTKIEANSSSGSGSSLFQILRHSSMSFDKQLDEKRSNCQEITETQAVYQFSAFKVGKRD